MNDREISELVMRTPFTIQAYSGPLRDKIQFFDGAINIAYYLDSDGNSFESSVLTQYRKSDIPSFKMQLADFRESGSTMMFNGIEDLYWDHFDDNLEYKHGKNPFNIFAKRIVKKKSRKLSRYVHVFVPDYALCKFIGKNQGIMPPLRRASDTAQEVERAALGLAPGDVQPEWREEFIMPKPRKVAEWNVRRSGVTTVYVPEYEK